MTNMTILDIFKNDFSIFVDLDKIDISEAVEPRKYISDDRIRDPSDDFSI